MMPFRIWIATKTPASVADASPMHFCQGVKGARAGRLSIDSVVVMTEPPRLMVDDPWSAVSWGVLRLVGGSCGGGEVAQQLAGRFRVFQHRGVSHARQQLDSRVGHDAVGDRR